ncbi:VIT domain-containing protein [Luteolibacter arcticus]|uniref:VIT domain-containing protein n=1 Tax=Luteolibacter arcticus TaxID=1581411 RepID=A0ABT3GM08_9BACT|nr:VIT domain-containing protein [Luteolibacter arcticus]MCW1924537.1 VIT domain-containing protein [Luteolibacter arcticus]
MKRLLGVLLWLGAALVLHAQGPRMTVAGTQTILEIEKAEVDIRVVGGVARTEMELVFRNDTKRMVEGEFTLPLPEGATVSSYALEVNGALREAVAVEKERASRAYETIKRQMIDPGIVERQAGNVYRTRVFPVPAEGTKRLRIGYVESLPREADGYRYRVPLKFEGLLKDFRGEITVADGASLKLNGSVPVSFVADGKGKRVCKAESVRLAGELELRVPLAAGPELVVEGEKEPAFLLNDVFPDLPEEKRPPARLVTIYWDASESGARLDPAATFRLLDEWFRGQREVKVAVKLLRDAIEDAGVHEVRGGDWSAIRKVLEAVDYDGATSVAGLERGDSELVIYCGDGAATWGGATTGVIQCPLFVLHRGAGETSAVLEERARSTGGALVNVDREDPAVALRRLQVMPFRVTGVSGDGVEDFQVEHAVISPGMPVRVSGRLTTGTKGSLEISYGVGTESRVRRQVALPATMPDEGLIRRLWAQDKLTELERHADRGTIVEHCRKHGLVSGETSLIVLERFEDHLTYEIPPPEPDLRKRYDEELAFRRQRRGNDLAAAWKGRLAWHGTAYPGLEYVLLPRLRQIGVWKSSVEKVFQPGDLDAKAFAAVTGWHDRALALIERWDALPDEAAYQAWLGQIEALMAEGPGLAKTPVDPPPAGKPLVVSVRGLVARPGQVRVKGKLTLKESVAKAGGPLWDGVLERVALYRSGGKTVFNAMSKRFEDIELRPGDMVVVESEPYDSSSMDPFAEAPESNPADEGPVVSDEDVWVTEEPAAGGSSDGAIGDGQERRATAGTIRLVDPSEAEVPDLAAFEARLKAGEEPLRAYLAVKDGKLRPDRFYIEASRRLFAAGHDLLATRVISTLSERGNGRAAAFWLMEFGKPAVAAQVLRDLPAEEGGLPVEFALAETEDTPREVADLLGVAVKASESMQGAVIALTEVNRLDPHAFPKMAGNLPCDLRITVQSQFAGVEPEIEVVDPTGMRLITWGASPIGGRLVAAPGVAEFVIRRGVPGVYRVKIYSKSDATFRVALHTDWGREEQKTVRSTCWIEGGERDEVAELEFKFRAAGR